MQQEIGGGIDRLVRIDPDAQRSLGEPLPGKPENQPGQGDPRHDRTVSEDADRRGGGRTGKWAVAFDGPLS